MIENIRQAILTGKLKKIEGIVQETLDSGESAVDILNAMIATMDEVGENFSAMRYLSLKCWLPRLQ